MLALLVPVMTYAAPLLCSLLLLPLLMEFSASSGWMVWGVTSILTLLLGADKEAAFFYLFIGWYPLIKLPLENRMKKASLPVKTAVFTLALTIMYLIL